MAAFDDLTKGLKFPMHSVSTPAVTQVREDGGKPTDQLLSIPEDGDTKSADPESWMKKEDFEAKGKKEKSKKLVMALGGLGMKVFEVGLDDGARIANFIDDDFVPPGEIWVDPMACRGSSVKDILLKDIIYCVLVQNGKKDRDSARRIVGVIDKALSQIADVEKD